MNSDWTPYVAMATSVLRHVVSALGFGGVISGDQIQIIVGAIAVVVSVVWGILQKQQTKTALNVATLLPPSAPPPKVPA